MDPWNQSRGLCMVKIAIRGDLTWLSALAMLLQGHATAAWLWIVSTRLSSARWIASCTVRPMSAQSLLTTSSHLFFGHPRPRWPCTYLSKFQRQLWIAILSHSAHVAKISKSSLLNPTVDILAQLQSVKDVFIYIYNLTDTRSKSMSF